MLRQVLPEQRCDVVMSVRRTAGFKGASSCLASKPSKPSPSALLHGPECVVRAACHLCPTLPSGLNRAGHTSGPPVPNFALPSSVPETPEPQEMVAAQQQSAQPPASAEFPPAPKIDDRPMVTIAFGSQTFKGNRIARSLHAEAEKRGMKCQVCCRAGFAVCGGKVSKELTCRGGAARHMKCQVHCCGAVGEQERGVYRDAGLGKWSSNRFRGLGTRTRGGKRSLDEWTQM
eukprot:1158518-Pelagomonas_calceolata.AAC.7